MLVRPHRATVLAQVEGVERIAFSREALRHVALEEVIAVAVHIEHGAPLGMGGGQAHEGRHHRAVVIGREVELQGFEARQQPVRLPARHAVRVPTGCVP